MLFDRSGGLISRFSEEGLDAVKSPKSSLSLLNMFNLSQTHNKNPKLPGIELSPDTDMNLRKPPVTSSKDKNLPLKQKRPKGQNEN